jgi:hypothetical protein
MKSETSMRAAAEFAAEARTHWRRVAGQADFDAAWARLDLEADRAMRRAEGERWARRLGLGLHHGAGRVVEVLLYGAHRDHRLRAAGIIARALRRRATGAEAA